MINKHTANRLPSVVPFQEQVTYKDRTSNDNFTPYTVYRARRKKVDKEDKSIPPEILVEAELMWQITSSNLPVVPLVRDGLVDSSGTTWTVIHVVQQLNGTVFNLLCRRAPK